MSYTLVNGELSTRLDVNDRGLHYGDGLFETLLVDNNRLQLWPDHMARLNTGCQLLKIDCPGENVWLDDIRKLVATVGNTDRHVIKLILTRGAGKRGYAADKQMSPTRITSISEYRESANKHRLRLCHHRISQSPSLAGIKHLNRLDNVMARSEWDDPDIFEGLLMDADDHIIEGTMSNVFFVRDDELYTPALGSSGVHGVMRQLLIDTALSESIPMHIEAIPLTSLGTFTAACVTNSLIGIVTVDEIDGHVFADSHFLISLKSKLDINMHKRSHAL